MKNMGKFASYEDRVSWAILWRLIKALSSEGLRYFEKSKLSSKNNCRCSKKTIKIILFLPKDYYFVNKNDLKGVTPMQNSYLGIKS